MSPPQPLSTSASFGIAEDRLRAVPPGMNIELQNKYGGDVLIDFDADFLRGLKPETPRESFRSAPGRFFRISIRPTVLF